MDKEDWYTFMVVTTLPLKKKKKRTKVNLEGIMPGEISQTEKVNYCIF